MDVDEEVSTAQTNGYPEDTESKTTFTDGVSTKPEILLSGRPADFEVLTKEHFSFNTRIKLGDFMEQKPGERVIFNIYISVFKSANKVAFGYSSIGYSSHTVIWR